MTKKTTEYTIDNTIPSITAYLADMVAHQEVFIRLIFRDVTVKFKQTLVGVAWLVIKPLAMALVLTFVFARVSGIGNSSASPYLLVVMAGLLPWQYFSMAVTEAMGSLVNNQELVTRVYFPRAGIPLATVVGMGTELLVSLMLMAGLMTWYGIWPGWRLLALPFWMTTLLVMTFSLGLFLAAMNARFRDIQYVLPFVLQLGMFASPIGYELASVPEEWRLLYSCNPFVGVAEGFRWALLPGHPFDAASALMALVEIALFLPMSIKAFLLLDHTLADKI